MSTVPCTAASVPHIRDWLGKFHRTLLDADANWQDVLGTAPDLATCENTVDAGVGALLQSYRSNSILFQHLRASVASNQLPDDVARDVMVNMVSQWMVHARLYPVLDHNDAPTVLPKTTAAPPPSSSPRSISLKPAPDTKPPGLPTSTATAKKRRGRPKNTHRPDPKPQCKQKKKKKKKTAPKKKRGRPKAPAPAAPKTPTDPGSQVKESEPTQPQLEQKKKKATTKKKRGRPKAPAAAPKTPTDPGSQVKESEPTQPQLEQKKKKTAPKKKRGRPKASAAPKTPTKRGYSDMSGTPPKNRDIFSMYAAFVTNAAV